MRRLLIAVAALAGLTVTAQAQEVSYGAQVGYAWTESNVSIPAYPSNFTLDGDGWQLGGFVGLNWDMGGGWSLGVEGDANWTDADGNALSGGSGGEEYVIEQNWNASIRARASVDIAASTELYGTLGLAWTDVETSYAPSAGVTDSATLQGWTGGVGLQRDYGTWFGRVEYRYSDYDSEGFFHLGPSNADLTSHAVLFGIGRTL